MTREIEVAVTVLPHGEGLPLPQYMTPGAAGMDLLAAVGEPVELPPGAWRLIPSGLAIQLPHGFEAQVRPRSGLAFKHGVTVLNAPGTIDEDYRGEVGVLLVNLGAAPFVIQRGERIAQLILAPVTRGNWKVTHQLEESARGEGGFGHTGR